RVDLWQIRIQPEMRGDLAGSFNKFNSRAKIIDEGPPVFAPDWDGHRKVTSITTHFHRSCERGLMKEALHIVEVRQRPKRHVRPHIRPKCHFVLEGPSGV